jgi:hypothetical protein
MGPNGGKAERDPTSRVDLVRAAEGPACLRLWATVVLRALADIDAGVRVLRAGPTPDLGTVQRAREAAAWLFGPAARRDRAWVCGWLGVEPGRLQKAVRCKHGGAVDGLLALP